MYQRSKHRNTWALSEEQKQSARDHINSFPVVDSHYCRRSTERQYLEFDVAIGKMYRLYAEQCNSADPVKLTSYAKILNTEFNLGFHVPWKDDCDQCDTHKTMSEAEKAKNEDRRLIYIQLKYYGRFLSELLTSHSKSAISSVAHLYVPYTRACA